MGEARVCINSNPTPSGVARQLVTFFCFAKKKVTKEKATPARRPFGVPSIFRQQAGLRNSPWRGTQNVPHCGAQTVLAYNSACWRNIEAAHRGRKSESQNLMVGNKLPTMVKAIRLRYIEVIFNKLK